MHKTKFAHSLVAAAALAAFLAAAPAQAEIKEKFISQPPAVQTGRLDGRVSAVPAAPDGRRGDRISKVSPQPTLTQQLMIALGMAPDEFVAQEEGLVLSEKEKR